MIFLLKNNRVIYSDDIKKWYKDIQFILFQCDTVLNTYILHEPLSYMVKMKKAIINMESVISFYNEDYEIIYKPLGKIKKEVTSYNELVQYLHSLSRIKLYNTIVGMSDCIDTYPAELINFCFFQIKLYDKNSKVIYKKKITKHEKVKDRKIYVEELFPPEFILDKIMEIYSPEIAVFKEYMSIDPIQLKWDYGKNSYKYNLCFLFMDETNSIKFFIRDQIRILNRINTLYSMYIVYDSKITDIDPEDCDMLETVKYHDFWLCEVHHVIENIVYLPYINMLLITIMSIDYDNDYNWKVKSVFEFSINGKEKFKSCFNYNPMSIDDLVEMCLGE